MNAMSANKLKHWAGKQKRELKALRIALSDNLVPWYVKLLVILTVAYLLSPIDLIPDFIPVLGLLDDLIIVPLLIGITIRLIPVETMNQCRLIAETREMPSEKNWLAGGVIIFIWVSIAAVILVEMH
ncbi:MAG: hypothetical protein CVV64_16565 [Candidatus Wallbacteria bacterium HGW-Wallbacteria-1]|uniref:DUF1232 domain-containing protein n=1 Tax=Candidatus Wallbacteria bacterium HGW-Wallbacteria-1 TaxID=2013854 RepID=A0A2N1PKX9_9BACT|nr:MAG: hypothetical protein CVV64_16565 [Candidatus Wallbacteria bacterium HGW-Wallbacteria-1]